MKAWGRNPQQFNPNTVQMNRSGKNSKSKDHLLVKVCFVDILFRGFLVLQLLEFHSWNLWNFIHLSGCLSRYLPVFKYSVV